MTYPACNESLASFFRPDSFLMDVYNFASLNNLNDGHKVIDKTSS